GLQSSNNAPLHVVAVRNVVRNARSQPDTRKLFDIHLRRKQQFKTWRKHTNDCWRWSKSGGHWKWFADDRSIAAEALLKIFVTQNRHGRERWWCISGWTIAILSGGRRRLRRAVRFLKVSARDHRRAHH